MLSRPLLDRVAFLGISWYAVLIVGAMVIGYFLASNEARRLRLPQDMGDGADLILQYQQVAFPKIREHLVGKGRRDPLVGTSVKQDAVLPCGIDLDDGVAAAAVHLTDIPGVHPAVREHFSQLSAVRADAARVVHLCPRTGKRERLVEPLAAAKRLQPRGGERFARPHGMVNAVYQVPVE